MKEINLKETKEMLQEKLRFEFGFAPKKNEITIKCTKGEVIEFYVNGVWYKLNEEGFICR